MKNRNNQDFIIDIITSIQDISAFIKNKHYDDFVADKKTYNAVIRSIEIIGEAAKNISIEIKNKYPIIPWKKLSGMRDKMIHGYFGIDNEILWETIIEDIPKLKHDFNKILKDQ